MRISKSDPNQVDEKDTNELHAFLYICVVIFFYACALAIVMIKYMKSEKSEAKFHHYYEEYVRRERFIRRSRKEKFTRLERKGLPLEESV